VGIAPWRVNTPIKSDVIIMLKKVMEAVEGELSAEDLMWFGDTLPPNVRHWDRVLMFLGWNVLFPALCPVALGAYIGVSAAAIGILLGALGASIGVLVLLLVVNSPFMVYGLVQELRDRKTQSDSDALEDTHGSDGDEDEEEDEDDEDEDLEEDAPVGRDDNSALQIEIQSGAREGEDAD